MTPARPPARGGRRPSRPPIRLAALRAPEADRSNALHSGAWWLWALGLAAAASRTTDPVLLALIVAVAGHVVAARRTDDPRARAFRFFLVLGVVVVLVRVLFAVVLGSPVGGGAVLFTLPEVPLPAWAVGVSLGGPVGAGAVLFAACDGLRMATVLVCLGAANALADPARLLKSLPGALYEVGTAVVVAMTFAPRLVSDLVRTRSAQRLRGRPDHGLRGLRRVALPVLEGSLERAVALAAAMDTRGYGRVAEVPPAVRRATGALTTGGLLGVCVGVYAVLADGGTAPLVLLPLGSAAALAGLWLGGRRSVRTRHRPDRWGARAWLVTASGWVPVAVFALVAAADPALVHQPVAPPDWPPVAPVAAAAALVGLLPAAVAPLPAGRSGDPGPTAPAP
ncbi:energy-coupling factor transporter transmembrane component T, partial [Streptomyces calidiresistens]